MPAIKSVEAALSLIKSDNSKILDLTVGTHQVTPGQEIPKTGRSIMLPSDEHPAATRVADKQL
jgi:hypothetical protein